MTKVRRHAGMRSLNDDINARMGKQSEEVGRMRGYADSTDASMPRELSIPERLEEAARSLDYASQEIAGLRNANNMLRMQLDTWDKALNLVNGQMYWTNRNAPQYAGQATSVPDLSYTAAELRKLAGKGDK